MTGEVVFHIGDLKTGSTAIQETLATGAFRAPGRRLLYPARLNHHPLARSFYVEGEVAHRDARMRELAAAVAASDADVAVVSAELFEYADPADLSGAIARWLPDHAGRVRVVAYVRPHAERLVSSWAEYTKQGFVTGTLEEMHQEFLRRGTLACAPRLARWRAVFGDALTVRPFLRARLKDGDVVADFLDVVFRGAPVTPTRRAEGNAALTLRDLAVLRAFQIEADRPGVPERARHALGWHFGRAFAAEPGATGARPQLHRTLAEAVVAAHIGDAEALDAAFFDGTPMADALRAAPGRAVDTPQQIAAETLLAPEELRLVRLWIEQTLVQVVADPEGFVHRLREAEVRALGLAEAAPLPDRAGLLPRLRSRLGRIAAQVRA